jgi:hypothetical protein
MLMEITSARKYGRRRGTGVALRCGGQKAIGAMGDIVGEITVSGL